MCEHDPRTIVIIKAFIILDNHGYFKIISHFDPYFFTMEFLKSFPVNVCIRLLAYQICSFGSHIKIEFLGWSIWSFHYVTHVDVIVREVVLKPYVVELCPLAVALTHFFARLIERMNVNSTRCQINDFELADSGSFLNYSHVVFENFKLNYLDVVVSFYNISDISGNL